MKGEDSESSKLNKNNHNSQKVVQTTNKSYSEMVLLSKAQALNAYFLLIVLT